MNSSHPQPPPSFDGLSGEPQPLPERASQTTAEHPWPVRLLSAKIADYVSKMSPVWVEGQWVDFKQRSGAWLAYATLRDCDADFSLPCSVTRQVMKTLDESVTANLTSGARVVVQLKPEYWAKRGSMTMSVGNIVLVGEGDLLARIEVLKRKLRSEGLFDDARKKRLPFLPTSIGLICGRDSAAERDVVVNATQRWPGVHFTIREVVVQGPGAPKAVMGALAELDALPEVDVIVLARGGGSLEDLLAFSDEALCRAVAACDTPVVSAIGHEVDCPVVDWVADLRASTPTDAGKRIVPAVDEELSGLSHARERLRRNAVQRLELEQQRLTMVRERPALAAPAVLIEREGEHLGHARERLNRTLLTRLTAERATITELRATVTALSPRSTLQRGYAVVDTGQAVVTSVTDVAVDDAVRVTVSDGTFHATVSSVQHRSAATKQ